MPGSLNVSFTFLCNPMILSSLTSHTSILPHVGGAEAVHLQPGASWVCRPSSGMGKRGDVHKTIISQHFVSVLLSIHQVHGFLRHIKGDSDVSHGEVTYFLRRRNQLGIISSLVACFSSSPQHSAFRWNQPFLLWRSETPIMGNTIPVLQPGPARVVLTATLERTAVTLSHNAKPVTINGLSRCHYFPLSVQIW